jgi:hypothetical protein
MSTSRTSFSILNVISYVEKLLKDREWLASGVQELYHRLQVLHGWTGPLPAKLVSGLPHVHSILDGLGVLTSDKDEKNAADHEEDTALFDLHFSTVPKAEENFHNLTFASNTLSPATSVGKDCEQPTGDDMIPKQALNSYLVFPQAAPLPTPPTDGFGSSIQHANQGKMHQDGDRDLFSLQQGWNADLTQAFSPTQMHTEEYTPFPHMPWSCDSNVPTTCVQTPAEQYDIQAQQSPLDPEQSPTIQLGQQMDYFSLGMEYPADVSSAIEFFADFDKILEERLFC